MKINKIEVGKRIYMIRKDLGLTMKEFGKRIGKPIASDSIVSRWEKGKSLPNNERLKRIAEEGQTTVDYLLYGSLDEYARTLLEDLKNELDEDDSISEKVAAAIISDVNSRLFPKFFPHDYKDRESLEKQFNEYKKDAIDMWTNYEKIELEIASRISHQISNDIYGNLDYFYVKTYDKKGEKGKKVSNRADEIVKRLEKLDKLQQAYIDIFRFSDNKEVVKELEKIDNYTEKLRKLNGN